MTNFEAIGRTVEAKKKTEGELKTLRMKAHRYGDLFSQLSQSLNTNPAGAVFDDQASSAGKMEFHFNSADFDIPDVKKLVEDIRTLEARLTELSTQLA